LLATALSEQAAAAALPAGLLNLTVQATMLHASGKAAAAGLISGQAALLAKGVLTAMFLSKLTTWTIMVLAAGVTTTGAGLWTYHSPAAQRTDIKDKKAFEPKVERADEPPSFITVPSRRDGIVRVIGTEIKKEEKVLPGQTITVKIDSEVKKFRRLKKGDSVEEGQLLGRLDDDLARSEVEIKMAKLNAARAESTAAEKTRDEALARFETAKKLLAMNGISQEDFRGALLTYNRYAEEAVSKVEAIKVAEQELKQARKLLEMHEIRSPTRGVIRAIYKRPGEAAKYLEPVFQIQVQEE
jgi:multidrug efflux pump subunit AcrA (membrane-fusion protein)